MRYILISLLSVLAVTSCSKFVDIAPPKNEVAGGLAFADDQTAEAAVVGMYANMNSFNYQFTNVLGNIMVDMSADEIYYAASFAAFDEFRYNKLSISNSYVTMLWTQPYALIYQANSCLDGLEKSTSLSPLVKRTLTGEALFIRSFCYFYLINYFGDVPLILTTDYQLNNQLKRTSTQIIYDTVEADLAQAAELLTDSYAGSGGRIRPNKGAVQALAARVALFTKQWTKAVSLAGDVISNPQYTLETDLNNVFLTTSKEAIWQLQSINPGRNTFEGNTMVPVSTPYYRLYPELIASFTPGDKRLAHWTGTFEASGDTVYYPFKYKVRVSTEVTENSTVLRLAEQYLIRAEAYTELGQNEAAIDDLNTIRHRAGIDSLSYGLDKEALLSAVANERRRELFTEWGHRWLDLKRTGTASAVLKDLKPDWQETDMMYPIPLDAISTNKALVQNPGYESSSQ